MVISKEKKLISMLCLIIIVVLSSFIYLYSKNEDKTKDSYTSNQVNVSNLLDEQKECLKYNYEIASNINVLDIISENKILVEDSNELKIYNLEKEMFDESLVKVSPKHTVVSAKIFNDGIVWVESNIEESIETKMFIKYFSDNKVTELGMSNSEILSSISITEENLIYYIVKDNIISINLLNLKERSIKLLESYELETDEGQLFVTKPNGYKDNIVWSTSINEKDVVYSYNIKTGIKNIISENDKIYTPVIRENKIFAIKKNDFYDSEIECEYAKDFIVEYDMETNIWSKFEEERINDYMVSPKECITHLEINNRYLYWLSPFYTRSVYDIEKKDFISLIDLNNIGLKVNVKMVKDNVIFYSCSDYEDRESKFIYVIPN